MSVDEWVENNPYAARQIYDTLSHRLFMTPWKKLNPITDRFRRDSVRDLAAEIIAQVLKGKK